MPLCGGNVASNTAQQLPLSALLILSVVVMPRVVYCLPSPGSVITPRPLAVRVVAISLASWHS
jgi:hypothetical protein